MIYSSEPNSRVELSDIREEMLVIDSKKSIYRQVWKWFFMDLHWVPPTLAVGVAALGVGFYLINVVAGCSARLCNSWSVWIGSAAVIAGGFMTLLGSAQLIAYLIQVQSIRKKLSKGMEVVLRRKRSSTNE